MSAVGPVVETAAALGINQRRRAQGIKRKDWRRRVRIRKPHVPGTGLAVRSKGLVVAVVEWRGVRWSGNVAGVYMIWQVCVGVDGVCVLLVELSNGLTEYSINRSVDVDFNHRCKLVKTRVDGCYWLIANIYCLETLVVVFTADTCSNTMTGLIQVRQDILYSMWEA